MVVNDGMDTPKLDPLVMTGLIDGTLSPAERRRALEVIASSPADYEWFVEASEARDVAPPKRVVRWVPLLAAASLLTAVGIGLLGRGASAVRLLDQPLEIARAVGATGSDPLTTRLGVNWTSAVGSGTRGSGSSEGRATAIRIGVSLADFEVAIAAGDSVSVAEARRNVVRLVASQPAGGPAARAFESLPWPASASQRRRVMLGIDGSTGGSPWTTVGSWYEAARLAAQTGQLHPLVDRSRLQRGVDALHDRNGSAAAAVARLAEIRGEGPEAAAAILSLLDSLLAGPAQ